MQAQTSAGGGMTSGTDETNEGVTPSAQEPDNINESDVLSLLELYSDIDSGADTIPIFSFEPLILAVRGHVKAIFSPVEYFNKAWCYFSNGEFLVPIIASRFMVTFFLYTHFRNRLNDVRRRLLEKTNFSDTSKPVLEKIDKALSVWQPSSLGAALTFIISPAAPVVSAIWLFLFHEVPKWLNTATLLSIPYILALPISAFLIKRGLMLGGKGSTAYFPGFISNMNGYEKENVLLKKFDVSRGEPPIDLFLAALSAICVIYIETNSMIERTMRGISCFIRHIINCEYEKYAAYIDPIFHLFQRSNLQWLSSHVRLLADSIENTLDGALSFFESGYGFDVKLGLTMIVFYIFIRAFLKRTKIWRL